MILSINCLDGTHVLRAAHGRAFPKEVGERKFSEGNRSGIVERIRQLYKAFRRVSPFMSEDMQLYFGPRASWEEKEPRIHPVTNADIPWRSDEDFLQVKKECRKRTVDVEISGKAKRGLYWILYLWSHPGSAMCFGPGLQEEVVWPIAAQIKCVKQLQEEIGLDKAEIPEIRWDDEREAEEKKEESEEEKKPEEERVSDTEQEA